ncbi:MAG: tetratricopeptide repeat protein [Gammaproteobacteria bacterium]|nr:tetratricopeptide repeat protein [Gammaproteobacteria bacterium]
MSRKGKRKGTQTAARDARVVANALEEAIASHRGGDIARAIERYEAVVRREPLHHQAWHLLGLANLQRGHAGESRGHFETALQIESSVAQYHLNYGAACEALDDLDSASRAYQQALSLAPDDADAHFNFGLVQLRRRDFDDAVSSFSRVLAATPRDAEVLENLARAELGRGDLSAAYTHAKAAVAEAPQRGESLGLLGDIALAQGALIDAVAHYEGALRMLPNKAGWLTNLGNAYRGLGRDKEARNAYVRASKVPGAPAENAFNLGTLEYELGDLDNALPLLRHAYELGVPGAASKLGMLLQHVYPQHYDAPFVAVLIALLEGDDVDAQLLAGACATQLRSRWGLSASHEEAQSETDISALLGCAEDPLATALLLRAINVDPVLERALAAVRRNLAARYREWTDLERTAAAVLALQCFYNEFAWAQDDVDASIKPALGAVPAQFGDAMIARAMYEPLVEWWPPEAPTPGVTSEDDAVRLLFERTLDEPRIERVMRDAIPGSDVTRDDVTNAVRAQYEVHPYPRWISAPREAGATLETLARQFPDLELAALRGRPLDILVAGCGTGQDPVRLAIANPGARVTAVDLSRTSLAYGQRMAARHGVEDIEFLALDLRELPTLGRQFDIISSTGVLHHMPEPMEGFHALQAVLSDTGLLKLGLYSRLARRDVDRARAFVVEAGFDGRDNASIRQFRAEVLAGQHPRLDFLLDSDDFYVTSGCRDLVFHVHERAYDLGELAEIFDKLGFNFIGFELDHPQVSRDFVHAAGAKLDDLRAWQAFEESNPAIFRSMYQFWLRKTDKLFR